MKKTYCVQNQGVCSTCSLVNYGLDCRNIPIAPMRDEERRSNPRTRHERMMAAYTGHNGTVTITAVLDQIPEPLQRRLTGSELGQVMNAVNQAYHNGKSACGAEVIDGEFVWINALNRSFNLSTLRNLPPEMK